MFYNLQQQLQSNQNLMQKRNKIKISIKIKPISNPKESIVKSVFQGKNGCPSLVLQIGQQNKVFEVDAIHDANLQNKNMFEDLKVQEFINHFIQGYNATILAYGHTGSGKSFCMQGSKQQNGIIHDSIKRIFQNTSSDSFISCSYLQLYNEKIFDLLSQNIQVNQSLKLRWEEERDFTVQDLTTHRARTSKQMLKLWKKGNKNRVIAQNKIHDMSSRSHSLFTITMHDQDQEGNFRNRNITFVDLAGSQRLFSSNEKFNKETIQINKSLFVLRKVIKLLQESSNLKKDIYIPYRDSKLTSLLKGALGGNCSTMMIACIDPIRQFKEQTLLTLSYAISAGKIQNYTKSNLDSLTLQNKKLKTQNQKLQKQVETLSALLGSRVPKKSGQQIEKQSSRSNFCAEMAECIETIRQLIKSNKQLREQLDQQRQIKKQLKLQIQMLLQQKFLKPRHPTIEVTPQPLSPLKSPSSPSPPKQSLSIPLQLPKIPPFSTDSKFPPISDSPRKLIRVREGQGKNGNIGSPGKINTHGHTRMRCQSDTLNQKISNSFTLPDDNDFRLFSPKKQYSYGV